MQLFWASWENGENHGEWGKDHLKLPENSYMYLDSLTTLTVVKY